MTTPNQIFTEKYALLLEKESHNLTDEIEQDFLNTAAALLAVYLVTNKNGKNFTLPKQSDVFFTELNATIYAKFEKYRNVAIRNSQLKNQRIFNKILDAPDFEVNRKIFNKTLKQRISKYTQMYKMEMEARIAMGIVNNESKAGMLVSIKKYLKNPYDIISPKNRSSWKANRLTRLFRPGTGTYKSAFANMERLGLNEVVVMGHRADYMIWNAQSNVRGILVYLSPAHPVSDICDDLVGVYPKGFFFSGFHVRGLCLATPIFGGKTISGIEPKIKEYMKTQNKNVLFYVENKKYW